MIEVTNLEEVSAIKSPKIRDYLQRRLKEVGYELNPKREGSFLYVENPELLEHKHYLVGVTLPSIGEGLLTQREAVTIKLDIIEISLLFNNEYLLSIVVDKNSCSDKFLQQIGLEVSIEKSTTAG